MIKYFCDRCGKEMNKSYNHIAYSDDSANLCKECFDEFSCWMNNNPMVCAKCGHEAKNYDDRLSELTAALYKAQNFRGWWSDQCHEIFKDCDALRNKVEKIMAQGDVR